MKHIMTVCGEVTPEQLGIVLPHEHVICDIARHSGNANNLLTDVTACTREMEYFKRAGGGTIVDVTTPDIGRDPQSLRDVSLAAGVNIVTCTGYYTEKTAQELIGEQTVDDLAAWMIKEITVGIGDTGIRPGVIGELGSPNHYVRPAEEKVLRAAGRAHRETGMSISLHAAIGRPGVDQLAILREEGVSLDRVIVGHADYEWHREVGTDLEYYQKLLDAGCYVEFDQIGWGEDVVPEKEIIKRVLLLLERGYSNRLLLSMDICRRSFYRQNGGHGYDYLLTHFTKKLQVAGLSDDQIRLIMTENPSRALAF